MTRPRPVFEGDILHIQRRIIDGQYLLRADETTNQLVRFAIAEAAERYNIAVHAACIVSNHLHTLITDTHGRHPEFTARAHRTIALGLHRIHKISGTIWEPGGLSVQRMEGPEAVLEAIGYIRANPIAAGCVYDEHDYPGLFGIDDRAPLRTAIEPIARPECFKQGSTLPEEAILKTEPVAILVEEFGTDGAASAITLAIRRHRQKARTERAESGLPYLGMKRVLAQSIQKRAKKPKSAGFNPTFKGVIRSAIEKASKTLRAFRRAYAEALAQLRDGAPGVVFPYGTYYLRRFAGVSTLPSA